MAKTGLGKGLSSLIPNKKNAQEKQNINTKQAKKEVVLPSVQPIISGDQVSKIAIEKIKPNPYQPRVVFGHNEMDDLMNSVKEHGILQPIVVSRLPNDIYQIIMGERRYRAAKMIGLNEVPVVIKAGSLTEQEQLELAIIENVQRKDLTPIEEARSYQRLVDEFGLTQEDVSERIGKKRSTVANIIRLLSLPEEIQNAINDNKITVGHAKTLLSLDNPVKQLEMYRKILVHDLNVRDSETMINKVKKTSIRPANGFKDLPTASLEESLRDSLHTKVSIERKGEKGRVLIYFSSDDELQQISSRIFVKEDDKE